MLLIIDPRLEDQYSMRAAQKSCSLAYYYLRQNPKAGPLMSDIVETLEPLQSNNTFNAPITFISPLTGYSCTSGVYTKYQMVCRYVWTVNSGGWCRAHNQSCSTGPAACRVRQSR
jgi:hypothetical protein